MNRLHVHVRVDDLEKSVRYYEALFGRAPDKHEPDYAKWLLDDPAANISLSAHEGARGVDHVGVQFADPETMNAAADRLRASHENVLQESDTQCCYAKSDKFWTRDPQGAVWELFHTFGDAETYGADPDRSALETGSQTGSQTEPEPARCC
ncbi:MAG: ArsI/CadI family heavy metal resistance metalloenzyme [Pseudomonadota bacterium]